MLTASGEFFKIVFDFISSVWKIGNSLHQKSILIAPFTMFKNVKDIPSLLLHHSFSLFYGIIFNVCFKEFCSESKYIANYIKSVKGSE